MEIPTDKLPAISSFASDYINAYDKVSEFFSWDFRDPSSFFLQAEKVRMRDLPREQVSAILRESNLSYGCGSQTLGNIEKLAADKACAVVTGQQTGLFSGPLYTIFKALTAIKLAESLNQNRRGSFVPVFWLASNDHDFAEIDHITLLDGENRIRSIQYKSPSAAPRSPVSHIELSGEISDCIQQLKDFTYDSEFKPEILSELSSAYRPGRTFVEAFARWMTRLFKSYGLIFIDAEHPVLKELGKDVFYTEIARNSPSTQAALTTSRTLRQKNYHTQIQLHEGTLNVFLVEGERHSLQSWKNGYLVKETQQTYRKEELLELVEEQPYVFSPNVLLRPLYQDSLLPTVAYVGGMSEVSYFAQMKDVYTSFNLPMPVIYPRKSLTLIEKKVGKALQAYSLDIQDIWGDADAEIKKIIRDRIPPALANAFSVTTSHIDNDLADIKRQTPPFEPGLEKSVDLTTRKIRQHIRLLEEKFLKAYKKQDAIMMNRMQLAKNSLFPNRRLQERTFTISPFLIKYGFALIDRLYEAVDLKEYGHQIIRVG